MKFKSALLIFATAVFLTLPAKAVVTLTFTYNPVSGHTVASYDGFWAYFDVLIDNAPSAGNSVSPTGLTAIVGTVAVHNADNFSGTTFAWTNGTAQSQQGDNLSFGPGSLSAPAGYTQGDIISGSLTFENTTLADLGLVDGQNAIYTTTGGNNSVNFSATTTAVPEPGTYAALAGFAALGFVLLRRRRANS